MKIGDKIQYRGNINKLTGTIVKIHGTKWCTVNWCDHIILKEHFGDLEKYDKLQT